MALNNLYPPKSVLWKCRKKDYACRSWYLRDIVEVYEMSRSAVVRKDLDKSGIIIHLRHQKKKKLSWCLAFGLSTSKTAKENISAFLCYPIHVIYSGSPWRLIHKQINKQLSSFIWNIILQDYSILLIRLYEIPTLTFESGFHQAKVNSSLKLVFFFSCSIIIFWFLSFKAVYYVNPLLKHHGRDRMYHIHVLFRVM